MAQEDSKTKDTNPKDAIGSGKIPLSLWPTRATILGAMAFLDGALKYGEGNYAHLGARASVYINAAMRHILAWASGEENDPDSGLPHLGHALACLAVLVDCQSLGNLVDDRPYPRAYRKLINELTPHVARLKELHKHRSPKHYSIQDSNALKETKCPTNRRKAQRRTPGRTVRASPDRRTRASSPGPAPSAEAASKTSAAG